MKNLSKSLRQYLINDPKISWITINRSNKMYCINELSKILSRDSTEGYTVDFYKNMFEKYDLDFMIIKLLKVKDTIIGGFTAFNYDDGLTVVSNLTIDKEYRGHGYGRKLIQEVEKCALSADSKKIALWVDKDNTTAINLYKSENYKFTKNDGLFTDDIAKTSYIMQKSIKKK